MTSIQQAKHQESQTDIELGTKIMSSHAGKVNIYDNNLEYNDDNENENEVISSVQTEYDTILNENDIGTTSHMDCQQSTIAADPLYKTNVLDIKADTCNCEEETNRGPNFYHQYRKQLLAYYDCGSSSAVGWYLCTSIIYFIYMCFGLLFLWIYGNFMDIFFVTCLVCGIVYILLGALTILSKERLVYNDDEEKETFLEKMNFHSTKENMKYDNEGHVLNAKSEIISTLSTKPQQCTAQAALYDDGMPLGTSTSSLSGNETDDNDSDNGNKVQWQMRLKYISPEYPCLLLSHVANGIIVILADGLHKFFIGVLIYVCLVIAYIMIVIIALTTSIQLNVLREMNIIKKLNNLLQLVGTVNSFITLWSQHAISGSALLFSFGLMTYVCVGVMFIKMLKMEPPTIRYLQRLREDGFINGKEYEQRKSEYDKFLRGSQFGENAS